MKRILVLLALAACTRGEDPTPAAATADPTGAPAVLAAQADTGEAAALAGSGNQVRRSGPTLTIATTGGAGVTLADDSTEGDSYKSYRYHGRVAGAPFHLIRVGYYEGGSWLLVHDSTGRQRLVDGPPVVGPGGIRLAVANMDLEAAFEPNAVEVFRLAGDSLLSEWRVEPADWGPDSLAWRGADTLTLIQQWRDSVAGRYRPVRVAVARSGAGWVLEGAPGR